jgi:glycosyltransferase involved in cell wall biosynthesis
VKVTPDRKIAVVIPSYRCKSKIEAVLADMPADVSRIYVVDDKCPEQTGAFVREVSKDARVEVVFHDENQGVGGAVCTGYRRAMAENMDVVVKIDGDGQMDPKLVNAFVRPILERKADYTKGNRFYDIQTVKSMPRLRLLGNAALSFMTKISSGYWNLFDPTNGYTAISVEALRWIPLDRLSRRYFFETDILFRLNCARCVIVDIPMRAIYGDEKSSLRIRNILGSFLLGHFRNFLKRFSYNYLLRDFSIASVDLLLGLVLLTFGVVFGLYGWMISYETGVPATSGSVMLAALPVIVGVQLVLSFLAYDFQQVPRVVVDRSSHKLPA